jgi:hypothetical protein
MKVIKIALNEQGRLDRIASYYGISNALIRSAKAKSFLETKKKGKNQLGPNKIIIPSPS